MKNFTLLLFLACSGCTLIRTDMVPRPTWYWSSAAKAQRAQDKEWKAEREGKVPAATNAPSKDWQGDLQKALQQEQARKLGQAMFDDTHPK